MLSARFVAMFHGWERNNARRRGERRSDANRASLVLPAVSWAAVMIPAPILVRAELMISRSVAI